MQEETSTTCPLAFTAGAKAFVSHAPSAPCALAPSALVACSVAVASVKQCLRVRERAAPARAPRSARQAGCGENGVGGVGSGGGPERGARGVLEGVCKGHLRLRGGRHAPQIVQHLEAIELRRIEEVGGGYERKTILAIQTLGREVSDDRAATAI